MATNLWWYARFQFWKKIRRYSNEWKSSWQQMIDIENVKTVILEDADEDYLGLYEVVWSLRSLYPRANDEVLIGAAQEAALVLLELGLIQVLVFQQEKAPSKLNLADAKRILRDMKSWWSAPGAAFKHVLSTADRGVVMQSF
ncbi:MAG: hypothetical protein AAFV45_14290 [Pseudomonadota bacterium]